MNRQIRRLGLALIVLFAVLFVQLNRLQVFGQERLGENPLNTRQIIRDFGEQRGSILTADGVLVAESVEVESDLERERRYPQAELYAHVTGFFSLNFGADGVEQEYNDELAGKTVSQQFGSLSDILGDTDTSADLRLTVHSQVQETTRQALGGRRGSVVALDPRSGDILAMYSNPTYDPNLLSTTDIAAADATWLALTEDPANPLLPRTYRETFFPGSTFKIVTAGAGLDSGLATPTQPVFPVATEYVPPQTTVPIRNFGGTACGGDLIEILRISCNTAFAELGAQVLGPDVMISGAERFGFNDAPPIDLPGAVASNFPTDFTNDIPKLAQSSIGQNDVRATPLQMAAAAGAVANGGLAMVPHVMDEIRDPDGGLVDRFEPSVWRAALDPTEADQLRQMMINVVTSGTAGGIAIPGFEVGGKTGTAQIDAASPDVTHAWIIGFAGPPGGEAQVAVSVIIEADPAVGQQTGGVVAAPVARAVLESALLAAP